MGSDVCGVLIYPSQESLNMGEGFQALREEILPIVG
jgi:hypothetical protein